MSIIALLFVLVVVGVILYVVNRVLPIDGKVALVINAVVILCVCAWVLQSFGLLPTFGRRVHW